MINNVTDTNSHVEKEEIWNVVTVFFFDYRIISLYYKNSISKYYSNVAKRHFFFKKKVSRFLFFQGLIFSQNLKLEA